MPIKGLSDQRRFSRGGKVRLGEKKVSPKSGKEYPAKLDYFLFDPDDTKLIPIWNKLFGEHPRRIKIAFPTEDPALVFPQWYKCYGGNGLLCKGDGENAVRRSEDGALVDVDCPGPLNCDYAHARSKSGPACKQVASLQFFIPDLPVMQVFQIDTSSYNSIVNMNSQLDVLRRVCGRISFLPVELIIKPYQTMADGKKVMVYVLDLVVGLGLAQIAALKPLVAGALPAEVPLPSEALPDDLYPRTLQALPEPAAPPAPEQNKSEDGLYDPYDEPPLDDVEPEPEAAQEAAPEPEAAPGLENDPDVVPLLAQLPAAKAQAMLASAFAGGWDKDRLVKIIRTHIKNAQPRSRDTEAAPQQQEIQPPAHRALF